jgi:MarR family 2-MHQ and catechol resistance regulon transcriptional repressor
VPEDRREAYYHQRLEESGPLFDGFDRLSAETAISLIYTSELLSQGVTRRMSEYGLSKATFNVLMILRFGPPEGMQLHDLGELLLVSKANITGLMDHLEEKDLVKRVVDSTDRRARYAHITKKAAALLDEYLPVHYGCIKGLLEGLTEEEKQTLLRLLKKTRRSVTRDGDPSALSEVPCGAAR